MAIYDDKTGVTVADSQVPFVTGNLPPKLEKRYMNPIRYRTNYRIVPGYALFCAVCLILGLVLMEIDDKKFLPVFLGLFALMAAVTVWLLRQVPKTRRIELALELNRYDLDVSDLEPREQYVLDYEGAELVLDKNGLTIDGKFYWYNHLNPGLVTTNRFNRIWLAIQFGDDPMHSLFVPLSADLIHAVQNLPIPLVNPEVLEFLLTHKENVFGQIYNTGTFRIFED